MRPRVALLGLDWGTTTLRAYQIDGAGVVLGERSAPSGILLVENGNFAGALTDLVADWLAADKNLPIIASGMIGARQGWREVPYADLPAGPDELAPIQFDASFGAQFDNLTRPIHFIPGLAYRNAQGVPDVMRGEETQIAGAGGDGLYLLPGSHSKWVLVIGGRITWFATFMTGELFAALKDHTILGRMMVGTADNEEAFHRGVACGHDSGATLQALFSARTLALFGDLPESGVAAYLSGLLIGAEIAEARALVDNATTMITIIGEAALSQRYQMALSACGLTGQLGPRQAAAQGQWRIAMAAGLVAA